DRDGLARDQFLESFFQVVALRNVALEGVAVAIVEGSVITNLAMAIEQEDLRRPLGPELTGDSRTGSAQHGEGQFVLVSVLVRTALRRAGVRLNADDLYAFFAIAGLQIG